MNKYTSNKSVKGQYLHHTCCVLRSTLKLARALTTKRAVIHFHLGIIAEKGLNKTIRFNIYNNNRKNNQIDEKKEGDSKSERNIQCWIMTTLFFKRHTMKRMEDTFYDKALSVPTEKFCLTNKIEFETHFWTTKQAYLHTNGSRPKVYTYSTFGCCSIRLVCAGPSKRFKHSNKWNYSTKQKKSISYL